MPLRPLIAGMAQTRARWSGWAEYQDTQYTSGSPFALTADQDTILPNNAGTTRDSQKPPDVATFYNSETQKITGRDGDGLNIFIYFTAVPATAAGNYIDLWLDIGDPVGELYRRTITFPKGNGVAAGISMSIAGFTLDTWETNGGSAMVRSSTNCSLYGIRYVLTRTHKSIS